MLDRKKMTRRIIGPAVLGLAFGASAQSSVWEVRADGNRMYVGGTCHVLRESDYPLPREFETAYETSGLLVFETDLGGLNDPEVQRELLQRGVYQDGTTLQEALSAKSWKTLKRYCHSADIPPASLQALKPWMAVLTLMQLELQRLGVDQEGVDMHFYRRAVEEGKQVGRLEPLSKQIDLLASMGEGHEDELVQQFVNDIASTSEMLTGLLSAWRNGDREALQELLNRDMKRKHPELYREIIVERNRDWMDELTAFARSPETEFVLVGAGHLVGEKGVLHLLEKEGFRVTRLVAAEE
ncbi:TraB/GumN family protein [Kiritimatiella glycovorans]|uniref:TraB family protein n=1 Tax=Kiritimatiella glycovorans TaxID=1307763 RepID=A0A0G3EJS3_9BACT|nr:TraB/GumN family protein [Kiritimatiella glycovorans]AKJ65697.1 TraB family protein [Kiritimatiella glycovorans]